MTPSRKADRISRFYRWLIAAPAAFLGISVGFAVLIFTLNSFYASAGMGMVGHQLTLRNYQRLFDLYYAEVFLADRRDLDGRRRDFGGDQLPAGARRRLAAIRKSPSRASSSFWHRARCESRRPRSRLDRDPGRQRRP